MEAKEELLENLKKLKEKITELNEKKYKEDSICWWNMEKCPFYSSMKGLENAGSRCCGCSKLDEERLFSILEDVFAHYHFNEQEEEEDREEDWKEKGKKEAEKEICEEISEEIEGILEGLD